MKLALGIVLPILAVIPLGGCGSSSETGTGQQQQQQQPAAAVKPLNDVLAAALERTKSSNAMFEVTIGDKNIGGIRNAQTHADGFHWNKGLGITSDDKLWTQKYDKNHPDDAWVHVPLSAVKGSCELAAITHPTLGLDLIAAAKSSEQAGANEFKGTLDLAKVTGPAAAAKSVEFVKANAKGDTSAVPFTAKTDKDGYLTEITAEFEGLPYKLKLSQFGVEAPVNLPDADAREASASVCA